MRFSTSTQSSSNNEMTTYDLHLCAVHANILRTANLLFVVYRTRDFQHSIRTAATKRWQLTTCQSPLVSAVHVNCLWTANLLFILFGIWDFQHSTRTAATKRRQPYNLPISTRVCHLCKLHANCKFVLHAIRNSRFSTPIRTAATKRRRPYDSSISTRVHCPCELFAKCKFALRERDSFTCRSSELPKKLMY